MTDHDKVTELYDKAEELIEQKPEFGEGETYGQVTISDLEDTGDERVSQNDEEGFAVLDNANELIEEKPAFGEGESYGEVPLRDQDEAKENLGDLPDEPVVDPALHELGKRNDHDDA